MNGWMAVSACRLLYSNGRWFSPKDSRASISRLCHKPSTERESMVLVRQGGKSSFESFSAAFVRTLPVSNVVPYKYKSHALMI